MDDYARHELLDRTMIATDAVNGLLIGHRNFNELPEEARRNIGVAQIALMRAYQIIGEAHMGIADERQD